MIVKKCLVIIMMLMSAVFAGCSGSSSDDKNTIPNLTTSQKEEDFEYLCEIFSENYPYLEVNKRMNGIDWMGNKNSYKSRVSGTSSNIGFAVELYKTVKELKCKHTHVILNDFTTFADIYLSESEFSSGNGPWKDIFSEAKPYYDDYWMPLFSQQLSVPSIKSSSLNEPLERKTMMDGKAATFKIIESGKTAYMEISEMAMTTEAEYARILDFYKQIKDYSNLIIDIRRNGGGNDYYWIKMVVPPLLTTSASSSFTVLHRGGSYVDAFLNARGITLSDISALPSKPAYPSEYNTMFSRFYTESGTIDPKDGAGFKGKIYLLTSDTVFSSSETFAMFCKQTGFATLVGTVTGGDGGGMDPLNVILPNSKLVVRFHVGMTLNTDGSSNFEKKTTPDVLIGANEDALTRTIAIISGK